MYLGEADVRDPSAQATEFAGLEATARAVAAAFAEETGTIANAAAPTAVIATSEIRLRSVFVDI